ncbi:uncharacterized protein LOC118203672 [Stegodyphus dumicola]|uniref:uncharacterized protein LOC118203672 n=1 Tax=Stegodyphus dumicola TaxID=202533 RepID=UPI0015A8565B|nr:uncharacterized protein LOC118203672 [Stegodyphus dumicola]
MVRFCDMLPSTVRHQTSAYSLAPNYYQPVYPQYNENCNVNSSTLTNVDNSGNGNYQQNLSSSWPAVYAVSANGASRQPIHYEDWMTAASNACSYQSQAIGYSTYHFQRNSSDVAPADFSLQSSGPMGLQECLGVTKTEGHPSPDSVVAVSSDGMSGSESPGLSLHINQNGVNGLCRPQPARSPFEWMKKTSYQSQPNPVYNLVYSIHPQCSPFESERNGITLIPILL